MSKIQLHGAALAAAAEIQRLRVECFKEGIMLRREIEAKVAALEERYMQLMDVEWECIWKENGITFPRSEPLALTVSPDGLEAFLQPVQIEPTNPGVVH